PNAKRIVIKRDGKIVASKEIPADIHYSVPGAVPMSLHINKEEIMRRCRNEGHLEEFLTPEINIIGEEAHNTPLLEKEINVSLTEMAKWDKRLVVSKNIPSSSPRAYETFSQESFDLTRSYQIEGSHSLCANGVPVLHDAEYIRFFVGTSK